MCLGININIRGVYISSSEIRKVLTNISKESGGAALINWIRPCENHFFWSATSTLSGNGNVIYAKFKSFLSHVINKHDNLDEPLYNKCNHGEIKHRTWLDKGEFYFNAMGSGIEWHEKSWERGKIPPSPPSPPHVFPVSLSIIDQFAKIYPHSTPCGSVEESITVLTLALIHRHCMLILFL